MDAKQDRSAILGMLHAFKKASADVNLVASGNRANNPPLAQLMTRHFLVRSDKGKPCENMGRKAIT